MIFRADGRQLQKEKNLTVLASRSAHIFFIKNISAASNTAPFTQECWQNTLNKEARRVYLYGTFLNTEVIQSERRITSPVLPLHGEKTELFFASVRLCIPLCTASVGACLRDHHQKLCQSWLCLLQSLSAVEFPWGVNLCHFYFPGWL